MRYTTRDGYEIDTDRLITDLQMLEVDFPALNTLETIGRLVKAIQGAESLLIESGDMEEKDATLTDNNQTRRNGSNGSVR